MKILRRILLSAFLLLFLSTNSLFAFEVDYTRGGKGEKMLQTVGYRILNANKIPYRTNFILLDKKAINAYATYRGKSIVVYDTTYNYLDEEDELAAILAHEISHIVDYNQGVLRGYFSMFTIGLNTKKYEAKADKRAIDYLVKAGYNPLAAIIAINKICDQPRYDWYLSHPTGSKRLANMYEYIYTKYPQYLVDNKYKDNPVYQNFLLTSRENRLKFQSKVQSKSKRQVNYL